MERLKNDIQEIANIVKNKINNEQIEGILQQIEYISKDISTKSDKKNTQSQIEFLNENLANINKEMIMKANIQDVMLMVDKKSNQDEVLLDMNYIKGTLQKHFKEYK